MPSSGGWLKWLVQWLLPRPELSPSSYPTLKLNVPTSAYKHYSQVNALHWYWPNFTPSEVACQQYHPTKGMCGCGGSLFLDHHAMDCLQRFRDIVQVPVIVNSPYRCAKQNKNWGGSPNSQHLKGRAFDIRITKSLDHGTIHKAGKEAGFTSFGMYDGFVHMDVRTNPAYWDYRSKK